MFDKSQKCDVMNCCLGYDRWIYGRVNKKLNHESNHPIDVPKIGYNWFTHCEMSEQPSLYSVAVSVLVTGAVLSPRTTTTNNLL